MAADPAVAERAANARTIRKFRITEERAEKPEQIQCRRGGAAREVSRRVRLGLIMGHPGGCAIGQTFACVCRAAGTVKPLLWWTRGIRESCGLSSKAAPGLDLGRAGENNSGMATQPVSDRFVTVEEYLSTSYEPDCEYDDGAVEERNLGEIEHSFLQTHLAALFTNQTDTWGVYGLTEQRVQIRSKRFVVPDVAVVPVNAPWQKILTLPPLIVIEILSPEDTLRRAEEKAHEYLAFGVRHVWVIDPYARVGYAGTESELQRVGSRVFTVPDTPIAVNLDELFGKMDAARARAGQK